MAKRTKIHAHRNKCRLCSGLIYGPHVKCQRLMKEADELIEEVGKEELETLIELSGGPDKFLEGIERIKKLRGIKE